MSPSASEAAAHAGRGDAVIGWKLDRDQRRQLLERFPPTFPNVVADHVTLAARAARDAPLPEESGGEMIGIARDDSGVEAMVVAIGGITDRPGGGTYHITWSLAPGRKAQESNDAIAANGWVDFDVLIPVTLHPASFR